MAWTTKPQRVLWVFPIKGLIEERLDQSLAAGTKPQRDRRFGTAKADNVTTFVVGFGGFARHREMRER